MHKEYVPQIQERFSFEDNEISYDTTEYHEAIDIGWDDNDFPTSETKACIDCFNDVEHDGFANYYCSSCGNWFNEEEIINFNK